MAATSSEGLLSRLFGRRSASVEELDASLVTRLRVAFGRVLRDFSDFELEMDDAEAKHRLARIGAVADGLLREEGPPDPSDPTLSPPWEDVRAVFTTQRRAERLLVTQTIDGFKRALLDVAQGLGRALDGDRGGDARVKATMESLRGLARSPSTDVARLRHAVIHAVEVVEQAAHERSARHQRQLDRLSANLASLQVELKQAQKRAETDALTGLDNRAAFDVHVAGTVALGALRATPVALLLLDLDSFKTINDRHGHPAGDAVLRAVADTLREATVRESDLVARFGGEEFAIVLHDCRERDALRAAERIRHAVQETVVIHEGAELRVTVSIGVAQRGDDEPGPSWIERADKALYAAKEAGRDRVRVAAAA